MTDVTETQVKEKFSIESYQIIRAPDEENVEQVERALALLLSLI